MNANTIINMIIRILMRKGINAGINKGMGAMRGRGGNAPAAPQRQTPSMTPEEQAEFEEFRHQKKMARKAARKQQNTIERM